MPWCPGVHRVKLGLFYCINLKILDKKARLRKISKYSPFSHWDFYTDLSNRLVATTVCGILFLLSVQCIVYARGEQTLASVFGVLGGYDYKAVIRVHVAYSSQCTDQRQWSWPMNGGQQPSQTT